MRDTDITAAEAARRLGVTRAATSKWADQGRFAGAFRDEYSGQWRIPESAVETMRQEREAQHENVSAD